MKQLQDIKNYLDRIRAVANSEINSPKPLIVNDDITLTLDYKNNHYDICVFEYINGKNYFELEEIGNYLITSETEKEIIYRCMLAKSIGIIRPDLKKDAEQLIVEFLEIHNKKKSRKGGFDA